MSTSKDRRRRTEEVRSDALAVGRKLLIADGPGAITLKAVGAELGMSHANLIHHFGSAQAFQSDLMNAMVADVTERVAALIERHGRDEIDLGAIVDAVFSAHRDGGIAKLIAWLYLSGKATHTEQLFGAIGRLCSAMEPLVGGEDGGRRARALVTLVSMMAFANGVIGPAMSDLVGERIDARALTTEIIAAMTGVGR